MMIEESGSGVESGSGSIHLTSGSGSVYGRHKNMWIRWIRIRIRNTAKNIRIRKKHRVNLIIFREKNYLVSK
jgi:hypothetical protein